MNVYKTHPCNDFLNTVSKFITDKFSSFDKLKVILPSGLTCYMLQRVLANTNKAMILPKILPLFDFIAEGNYIFNISTNMLNKISRIEEEFMLAEILCNYNLFAMQFSQSLSFANQLSDLLNEFIYNDITINNLEKLHFVNQPEHWRLIFNFLKYIYNQWQNQINLRSKIDTARYIKLMIELELQHLIEDKEYKLVIAGILGTNKTLWDFLKKVSVLENVYIILPPAPYNIISNNINYMTDSEQLNIYCIKKFLDYTNIKLSDLRFADIEHSDTYLDLLLIEQEYYKRYDLINPVNYIECKDIFEEADVISNICLDGAKNGKKICIVLNTLDYKDIYISSLCSYGLLYIDLLGINIINTDIGQLVISLSNILCLNFDLKKFFVLYKNPLIYSDTILKLENYLNTNINFIDSWESLRSFIYITNDTELIDWYNNNISVIANSCLYDNFYCMLDIIIDTITKFSADIWSHKYADDLLNLFRELYKINKYHNINNKLEFPNLLYVLLSNKRSFNDYYSGIDDVEIVICSPQESVFMQSDIFIIPDFNQGKWPRNESFNPWLNKEMYNNLSIHNKFVYEWESLYNFYMILHNKNVVITRSKKQSTHDLSLASNYILKLQFIYSKLDLINAK